MNSNISNIQVLMDEHNNIRRMLKVLKHHCLILLNNPDSDISFFYKFIDFTRNYADKHHHGKEELILFDYMVNNLGPAAEKLVKAGMLVEHDLGRHYIGLLEKSLESYKANKNDEDRLNILMAAMTYAELLGRHTDKEDEVVYPFAIRALSKELMAEVDTQSDAYEEQHNERKVYYENMLENLESLI